MEVICLEDEAFFALIERVVSRIKKEQSIQDEKWISSDEAMQRLRVKSSTTLQKLRDEGKIRFSQQPGKRVILYDTNSIKEYLEKNAKNTF